MLIVAPIGLAVMGVERFGEATTNTRHEFRESNYQFFDRNADNGPCGEINRVRLSILP